MAYAFNRGTKDDPKWACRYKDANGKWRMVKIDDPTVRTKKEAELWAEKKKKDVAAGKPDPRIAPTCGELMKKWIASLTNRDTASDKSRHRLHLEPKFQHMRVRDVTVPVVMAWIDEQRAADDLADGSIRHNLNALSRFMAWAIERGHAEVNVVRSIPSGKRPRQAPKAVDRPWLNDEKTVRDIMNALAPPFRELFYLGNRSGLRPGEVRGLRLSDFAFLADGALRVRFSDDGPLKEDKDQSGKVKWAPAPDDFDAVIGPLLARRRAEGAGPEDYLFGPEFTRCALKQRMEEAWSEAVDALEIPHTLYEATRHSFVSRNLAAGASLDEVSAAIGHSSPTVTRRYYDHFVRKTFSAGLRAGLGAPVTSRNASVIQLRNR